MSVTIYPSAHRHGITGEEIRAVLAYPIVRYRVRPWLDPNAEVWRMVGGPDGGPLVEIVAEATSAESWHVFHAMLLTPAVAREIEEVTAGEVDLTALTHRRQRREQDTP